ncbi:MAG: cell division FtsZ family protein, partial [Opitutaceae bacterium]|nr:cell division FtsZ family protein [Opitutaceae bacterium]
ITTVVKDCDLVFLVTGMGGGTGSGVSPVVAEVAAEGGALVIAFVTLPFSFEGGRRLKQAEEGLRALRAVCDAVIPLPNDVLLQEAADNETVLDSFARADEWIGRGVKSIWAMLSRTGLINVDFTALRQVFQQRGGKTLFGLGVGSGDNPAQAALDDLKLCPLLHTPEYARKADRLLVNITGGADLSLTKVNELMSALTEEFGRDAHVVMGAAIDEALQGRVEICVIGTTDLGSRNFARRPAPATPRRADSRPPGPTATGVAPESSTNVKTTVTPGAARPPAGAADQPTQEVFSFGAAPTENRGTFDKSDRNLFEGQDLDVPTYYRKGIKVSV